MRFNSRKNSQFILAMLFLAAIFVWISFFSQSQASNDKLTIKFLNVGQGDAAYIKNPDGTDILIDGGPDDSVLAELGKVMSIGDREINLVVLTHPHEDHLNGLLDVVDRYKVDEVWQSGVEYPSQTYTIFNQLIKEKSITNKNVKAGDEKDFGPVKFLVLAPLLSLENKTIDNLNNASIINRLEYNQFTALFLGDAEIEAQNKILPNLQSATVIKISHHGSSNGVNQALLEAVRPVAAVISVGKDNKYGHPAASTIKFNTYGRKIRVT